MSRAFYTEQATILRAGTKHIRGASAQQDWDNPTRTPTGAVLAIDPLTANDDTVDETGDVDVEAYNVQTAPKQILDLRAGDRIEWNGLVYRIRNTFVRLWAHPLTGQPDHQEFVIERYTTGPANA